LYTFSQGGGVQSTAALVLSAQGRIDFPVHLFANVGDDSENPETLSYVREVSMPYAEAHGVELIELRRPGLTLLQRAQKPEGSEVYIPIRGSATGKPWGRECTDKYKIQVVNRWLRKHGATAETPAVVGIGISVDEIERATGRHGVSYRRVEYPLLTLDGTKRDRVRLYGNAVTPPVMAWIVGRCVRALAA
jgi:3'-phosphoadenosine 5'-phosphosulfate sulfotransferase (PAPS reductase)/FAD synthetase